MTHTQLAIDHLRAARAQLEAAHRHIGATVKGGAMNHDLMKSCSDLVDQSRILIGDVAYIAIVADTAKHEPTP